MRLSASIVAAPGYLFFGKMVAPRAIGDSQKLSNSPDLNTNTFFVITGGPGVGKTTLLQELQKRFFTCIPEVAREIIREQVALKGDALPWKNKELYLHMMFDRSVSGYLASRKLITAR